MDDIKKVWSKIRRLEGAADAGGMGRTENNTITIAHEETKTIPFDSILGAKIVDKAPGRLRLITPARRPPEEVSQTLFSANTGFGGVQATYGTNNGLFSNRTMMIVGESLGTIPVGLVSFCYAFATVFKDYNALMYVYETVSDTKGMGVTLNPGWYAVNYSTLAYTEFDIEKYPCHGYSVSSYEPRTGGVSLYFEDAEVIRYTVTEDNVGVYQGEQIVSFAPMREYYEAGCALTKDSNNHHLASMSLLFLSGTDMFFENYICAGTPSLTISYQIAHPIDPKFLPEGVGGKTVTISDTSYYGIWEQILTDMMMGVSATSATLVSDAGGFFDAIPGDGSDITFCVVLDTKKKAYIKAQTIALQEGVVAEVEVSMKLWNPDSPTKLFDMHWIFVRNGEGAIAYKNHTVGSVPTPA